MKSTEPQLLIILVSMTVHFVSMTTSCVQLKDACPAGIESEVKAGATCSLIFLGLLEAAGLPGC